MESSARLSTHSQDWCTFRGMNENTKNVFSRPVQVEDINGKDVKSFNAGLHRAVYMTQSGELYTWEYLKEHREVEHGSATERCTPKILKVPFGEVWSVCHIAVLTESRKVDTFGSGSDRKLPTLVQALETVDIKQVLRGQKYTMALSTSGRKVKTVAELLSYKKKEEIKIEER